MQKRTHHKIRHWLAKNKAQKLNRIQQELAELLERLDTLLSNYEKDETSVAPFDIALILQNIRDRDNDLYLEHINTISPELMALVLLELPLKPKEEAIESLPNTRIATMVDGLESDDATRILKDIEQYDEAIAQEIITNVTDSSLSAIETLRSYLPDEAGAHMQTEILEARPGETIATSFQTLKKMKEKQLISNVHQIFVTDENRNFLGSVKLDDLVTLPQDLTYDKVLNYCGISSNVNANQKIDEIIQTFQKFGIPSIAVTDENGKLMGRITADDIYNLIQSKSTEQLYNLAMVNNKAEEEEEFWSVGKTRAFWLGINLLTAIAAALVIGLFDATIQSLVALAILMPIVASMGGNAGTQTLTVIVRQLALGEIDSISAKKAITKEVYLATLNGLLYAIVMGVIAYVWFNLPMLGVVIGAAMLINLMAAGFFGAMIPIGLKRMNIDPAIGSTVVLTTVTDVVGFFSFLGLASVVLL